MDKIRNLADLRKMKEGMQSRMSMRENSDSSDAIIQIKVGTATRNPPSRSPSPARIRSSSAT